MRGTFNEHADQVVLTEGSTYGWMKMCSDLQGKPVAGVCAHRLAFTTPVDMMDFDGDTATFTVLYSEEAIKETTDLLGDVAFYVNTTGGIAHSCETDTVKYLMKTFTGEPTLDIL